MYGDFDLYSRVPTLDEEEEENPLLRFAPPYAPPAPEPPPVVEEPPPVPEGFVEEMEAPPVPEGFVEEPEEPPVPEGFVEEVPEEVAPEEGGLLKKAGRFALATGQLLAPNLGQAKAVFDPDTQRQAIRAADDWKRDLAEVPGQASDYWKKMQTRWAMGREQAADDQLAYKAATGEVRWEDVKDQLEPSPEAQKAKGEHWYSEGLLQATEMVPAMLESLKEGVHHGFQWGGAAAGATAIAGQLGPQVALPEEFATVPLAAGAGYAGGQAYGTYEYWRRQGTGSLYNDLRKEGIGHEIAKNVSATFGVPYAGIEFLQLTKLVPGMKQAAAHAIGEGIRKRLTALAKEKGVEYVEQIGQETSQEVMQATSEALAEWKDGVTPPPEKKGIFERAWNTIVQTSAAMPFLMGPKTATDVTGAVAQERAIAAAAAPVPGEAIPPPIPPTPDEAFAPGVTITPAPGEVPVPPDLVPPAAPPGVAPPVEPTGDERFAPPPVYRSIFSTDPEARTDLAEYLTDKMDRGLGLAHNVQPDGSIKVGFGSEPKNELTVDLTPEERKALKMASNDYDLARQTGAMEEVAVARKAMQDILEPATRRRLAEAAAPLPTPVEPGQPPTPEGVAVTQQVGAENLVVKEVADSQAAKLQSANAPKTAQAIQQVAARSNAGATVSAAEFLQQARAQAAEAQAEADEKAAVEAEKVAKVAAKEAPAAAPGAVAPGEFAQPGYTAAAPAVAPEAAPAPEAAAPAQPTEYPSAVVVGGQVFTGATYEDATRAAHAAVGPDAMLSSEGGWVNPETGKFVSHEVFEAHRDYNTAIEESGNNMEAPAVQEAQARVAEAVARDDELNSQIVSPGGEQVIKTGIKGQQALVSVRPSQELAVPLAGVAVNVGGVTPEGQRTTAQRPAAQALNDARNDRTAFTILLNCLT